MTTVPAEAPSVVAVAAGPMTRLPTSANQTRQEQQRTLTHVLPPCGIVFCHPRVATPRLNTTLNAAIGCMIILCDVRVSNEVRRGVNVRIPRADDPRDAPVPLAAGDASRNCGTPPARFSSRRRASSGTTSREVTSTVRPRRSAGSGARAAGRYGGPQHGDEAVRVILAAASPEALVWLASRAISYMDENGFPEAVAPWIPDDRRGSRSLTR